MLLQSKRRIKVLDFDIENRPITYLGKDFTTAEITVIASCWTDDFGSMKAGVLGRDEPEKILTDFLERYNEADIVVGHYIRKHDLSIINGSLMEYGLPTLGPKMTCDTYFDLRKKSGISSSQEALAEMLGIEAPKVHMSQGKWRASNRLTRLGILAAETRATGDVIQNILMRERMLELGLLKAPRVWKP